jgi:hypothetical protein
MFPGPFFVLLSFYFCHHNISSYDYLHRMEELNHDFDVPSAELNAIKFDFMSSADMVSFKYCLVAYMFSLEVKCKASIYFLYLTFS